MPFKNRPRIKEFDYRGEHAYFITLCVRNRENVFINEHVFGIAFGVLKDFSEEKSFLVHAYCFMPDHVHFLLQGMNEKSNLKDFIKDFKQKSGYEYSKAFKSNLWQPSYYDHVLRREESLKDVALYILNNPVRKGLVGDFCDYPFLGSLIYDINEL